MIQINSSTYLDLLAKQKFVTEISKAIVGVSKSSIKKIEYDIFWHDDSKILYEYLVVTYSGNAIATRNCRGNSIYAIFEEIGKLFNGGYYDEVEYYKQVKKDSISFDTIIRSDLINNL